MQEEAIKTMTELKAGEHMIQIRRKEGTSHVPAEIRQSIEHRLSSVFKNGRVHVGVPQEIIDLCMPLILDEVEGTPEFRKASQEFWYNINIKVGSEGAVLDASVGEDGIPVNPREFLHYHWALTHPQVAESKAEMDDSVNKAFYIYDPEIEVRKKNKMIKIKADAMKEYVKVLDDESMTSMVLRVLGNKSPGNLTKEQRENLLTDLMEADPARFLRVAQDDKLKQKAFINQLLDANILRKSGNTHFYMDESLGTLDETIAYISKKSNSSDVADMKAKLKEVKVG